MHIDLVLFSTIIVDLLINCLPGFNFLLVSYFYLYYLSKFENFLFTFHNPFILPLIYCMCVCAKSTPTIQSFQLKMFYQIPWISHRKPQQWLNYFTLSFSLCFVCSSIQTNFPQLLDQKWKEFLPRLGSAWLDIQMGKTMLTQILRFKCLSFIKIPFHARKTTHRKSKQPWVLATTIIILYEKRKRARPQKE